MVTIRSGKEEEDDVVVPRPRPVGLVESRTEAALEFEVGTVTKSDERPF